MKRFTETKKWQDSWFSELAQSQKLLWLYLCDNCDNSGVIDLSRRIAKFLIGSDSNIDDDIKALGDRVEILPNKKLFIPGFISFQFGVLSEKSNLHRSVFQCIDKNKLTNIFKPSGSLQVASTEVTSKGIVKYSKGKGNSKGIVKEENLLIFDIARKLYPGTKRGLEVEYKNFTKKHPKYLEILPLLEPSIRQQIEHREKCQSVGSFVRWWKNFKTWINESCWTEEPCKIEPPRKTAKQLKDEEFQDRIKRIGAELEAENAQVL